MILLFQGLGEVALSKGHETLSRGSLKKSLISLYKNSYSFENAPSLSAPDAQNLPGASDASSYDKELLALLHTHPEYAHTQDNPPLLGKASCQRTSSNDFARALVWTGAAAVTLWISVDFCLKALLCVQGVLISLPLIGPNSYCSVQRVLIAFSILGLPLAAMSYTMRAHFISIASPTKSGYLLWMLRILCLPFVSCLLFIMFCVPLPILIPILSVALLRPLTNLLTLREPCSSIAEGSSDHSFSVVSGKQDGSHAEIDIIVSEAGNNSCRLTKRSKENVERWKFVGSSAALAFDATQCGAVKGVLKSSSSRAVAREDGMESSDTSPADFEDSPSHHRLTSDFLVVEDPADLMRRLRGAGTVKNSSHAVSSLLSHPYEKIMSHTDIRQTDKKLVPNMGFLIGRKTQGMVSIAPSSRFIRHSDDFLRRINTPKWFRNFFHGSENVNDSSFGKCKSIASNAPATIDTNLADFEEPIFRWFVAVLRSCFFTVVNDTWALVEVSSANREYPPQSRSRVNNVTDRLCNRGTDKGQKSDTAARTSGTRMLHSESVHGTAFENPHQLGGTKPKPFSRGQSFPKIVVPRIESGRGAIHSGHTVQDLENRHSRMPRLDFTKVLREKRRGPYIKSHSAVSTSTQESVDTMSMISAHHECDKQRVPTDSIYDSGCILRRLCQGIFACDDLGPEIPTLTDQNRSIGGSFDMYSIHYSIYANAKNNAFLQRNTTGTENPSFESGVRDINLIPEELGDDKAVTRWRGQTDAQHISVRSFEKKRKDKKDESSEIEFGDPCVLKCRTFFSNQLPSPVSTTISSDTEAGYGYYGSIEQTGETPSSDDLEDELYEGGEVHLRDDLSVMSLTPRGASQVGNSDLLCNENDCRLPNYATINDTVVLRQSVRHNRSLAPTISTAEHDDEYCGTLSNFITTEASSDGQRQTPVVDPLTLFEIAAELTAATAIVLEPHVQQSLDAIVQNPDFVAPKTSKYSQKAFKTFAEACKLYLESESQRKFVLYHRNNNHCGMSEAYVNLVVSGDFDIVYEAAFAQWRKEFNRVATFLDTHFLAESDGKNRFWPAIYSTDILQTCRNPVAKLHEDHLGESPISCDLKSLDGHSADDVLRKAQAALRYIIGGTTTQPIAPFDITNYPMLQMYLARFKKTTEKSRSFMGNIHSSGADATHNKRGDLPSNSVDRRETVTTYPNETLRPTSILDERAVDPIDYLSSSYHLNGKWLRTLQALAIALLVLKICDVLALTIAMRMIGTSLSSPSGFVKSLMAIINGVWQQRTSDFGLFVTGNAVLSVILLVLLLTLTVVARPFFELC